MVIAPRATGYEHDRPALSWYTAHDWLVFICPNGHPSALCRPSSPTPHTIRADGTVEPSVVCLHEGCTFHDHVKLAGYNG